MIWLEFDKMTLAYGLAEDNINILDIYIIPSTFLRFAEFYVWDCWSMNHRAKNPLHLDTFGFSVPSLNTCDIWHMFARTVQDLCAKHLCKFIERFKSPEIRVSCDRYALSFHGTFHSSGWGTPVGCLPPTRGLKHVNRAFRLPQTADSPFASATCFKAEVEPCTLLAGN